MALTFQSSAPAISLNTLGGEAVSLDAPQENATLLLFFTPTCSWCDVALPRLMDVLKHRTDVPLRVLGVAHGDPNAIAASVKSAPFPFPILHDTNGEAMRAYQIERVPTAVLLSAQNQVLRVYEGWTEQLPGILEQSIIAAAHHLDVEDHPLPDYTQIGNGCAPE